MVVINEESEIHSSSMNAAGDPAWRFLPRGPDPLPSKCCCLPDDDELPPLVFYATAAFSSMLGNSIMHKNSTREQEGELLAQINSGKRWSGQQSGGDHLYLCAALDVAEHRGRT